jgi:hypothetical protein
MVAVVDARKDTRAGNQNVAVPTAEILEGVLLFSHNSPLNCK